VSVPVQAISNLANLVLTGQAVAGGMDTLIVSTGDTLYAMQNLDNMLDLASAWMTAEFNIVGDCCRSSANFNAGSTIADRTRVASGVTTAPTCFGEGFTGETNNLYFQPSSGTPRSSTQPAIVFTQSTDMHPTSPCNSAVAVPAASKVVDTRDFEGDGFSDIVWSDSNGNIAVWLMSSAQVILSGTAGTAPPGIGSACQGAGKRRDAFVMASLWAAFREASAAEVVSGGVQRSPRITFRRPGQQRSHSFAPFQ
jgi:hypothetical protein